MASATAIAVGRLGVPLNAMCSMKCATPWIRSLSPRDPAPTNTLTLTDCDAASGVVTTRSPPGSCETSGVTGMVPSVYGGVVQRGDDWSQASLPVRLLPAREPLVH